jgi:Fur family peroxide stress response transcriptional regulator
MNLSRQESMDSFLAHCRAAGMRVTPQRLEVFRELAQTDEHPDAETVFRGVRRRMPTVSLDTVYRTLWRLEEQGLISRVQVLSERARFDGNAIPHPHFVCTRCGLVRDVEYAAFNEVEVPARMGGVGTVEALHVELRGICTNCRQASGARARRDSVS